MLELYRSGRWADLPCADRLQPIFWYSLALFLVGTIVFFYLVKLKGGEQPPNASSQDEVASEQAALVIKVIIGMAAFCILALALIATLSPNLTETWIGNTEARETGCHRLTPYSHSFDFTTARKDFRYFSSGKGSSGSYDISIRQNGKKLVLHFSPDDKKTIQRLYELTPYLMDEFYRWIELEGLPVPPELLRLSDERLNK